MSSSSSGQQDFENDLVGITETVVPGIGVFGAEGCGGSGNKWGWAAGLLFHHYPRNYALSHKCWRELLSPSELDACTWEIPQGGWQLGAAAPETPKPHSLSVPALIFIMRAALWDS